MTTVASLFAAFIAYALVDDAYAQCPPPPTILVESEVLPSGSGGAVAIQECGQFIIAWQTPQTPSFDFDNNVFVQRYAADGTLNGSTAALNSTGFGQDVSIAMSRDGHVLGGWIGIRGTFVAFTQMSLLTNEFDLDTFNVSPQLPPLVGSGDGDHFPSVGTSDVDLGIVHISATGWSNAGVEDGLEYMNGAVAEIRDCSTLCAFRVSQWRPSVATRSEDGYAAIAWADAENDLIEDPPFNIALRVYNPVGNQVDQRDGTDPMDPWVSDPTVEPPLSQQTSPAISFVGDDIVVTWVGPGLAACEGATVNHIYVRRFKFNTATETLRDPDPNSGEGRAGLFVVDNDANPNIAIDPDLAHPTVALTLDTGLRTGSFVVAWNTRIDDGSGVDEEVRAQYLDAQVVPRGAEFRVNQDNSDTDTFPNRAIRRLANSAQHTLAYGAGDQVVATWSPGDDPDGVYFTLLPVGHADTLEVNCCKGDVNDDGLRNGLDIQPFVDLFLNPPTVDPCLNIVEQYLAICAADMNSDGVLDVNDVPPFVAILLSGITCAEDPTSGFIDTTDCNGNGQPDVTDILVRASQDCNANGIPDECEIDANSQAPGGPFYCTVDCDPDCNGNGIPDECETDCNANGVPDDCDLAAQTSSDINGNSIPDECEDDCNGNGIPDDWDIDPTDPDGNGQVSPDCNANGVPDECETDCNANGVPDDCDIDPTDPDGNGQVSADCNGNNWPDECDLTVPQPFGSLDCNDNGIPDECDIADCTSDPSCADCNLNGIPDGCDITAGISLDTNSNGIPDECEQQQSQGGGGSSPTPEGSGAPEPEGAIVTEEELDAAWAAFYNWSFAQSWGPGADLTCAEQFQAMVDKLHELGLPVEGP